MYSSRFPPIVGQWFMLSWSAHNLDCAMLTDLFCLLRLLILVICFFLTSGPFLLFSCDLLCIENSCWGYGRHLIIIVYRIPLTDFGRSCTGRDTRRATVAVQGTVVSCTELRSTVVCTIFEYDTIKANVVQASPSPLSKKKVENQAEISTPLSTFFIVSS